ncbi:unnamed protein product [Rhizophagus irregularis]|nr:unnamed protein product [Rhizophagus irregularis]
MILNWSLYCSNCAKLVDEGWISNLQIDRMEMDSGSWVDWMKPKESLRWFQNFPITLVDHIPRLFFITIVGIHNTKHNEGNRCYILL